LVIKENLNFTASISFPFSKEFEEELSKGKDVSIPMEPTLITPRTKRENIPYYESIKALNKIESYTTPKEKLHSLTQMYGNLKTAVVDFYKGKVYKSSSL